MQPQEQCHLKILPISSGAEAQCRKPSSRRSMPMMRPEIAIWLKLAATCGSIVGDRVSEGIPSIPFDPVLLAPWSLELSYRLWRSHGTFRRFRFISEDIRTTRHTHWLSKATDTQSYQTQRSITRTWMRTMLLQTRGVEASKPIKTVQAESELYLPMML